VTVPTPTFTMTTGETTATAAIGGSTTVIVSITPQNGFQSAVTLSVTGLPKGVTATFAPSTIASAGSGSSTLMLVTSSSASTGTVNLTAKATGGGVTQTKALSLTVTH
jgi:hypothetical protein